MSASLHAAESSSMCLRRHCPARASPAQSFSISELQAERTFPLLPQEETQIDTMIIIETSNPRLVKLFKSRLDISATPKVVVRWSDGLIGCWGRGTSSSFSVGLAASPVKRAAKQPRWSCRPSAAKRRSAEAARQTIPWMQTLHSRPNRSGLAYLSYNGPTCGACGACGLARRILVRYL